MLTVMSSHIDVARATPVPASEAPFRQRSPVVRVAFRLGRQVPFTTAVVVVMLTVALATGSLWTGVEARTWFTSVGYGVPSLAAGRWWTPVSGAFFALTPWFYLPMVGSFALLVGFTEWRLGTGRAILLTILGHLTAMGGSVLVLLAARHSAWRWATDVSGHLDAGLSAGALAALAVTTAVIRAPWRLRIRVALVTYVVLSFIAIGSLADLMHLVAVAVFLPLGHRLAGRSGVARSGRPSRREWRLLAVAAVALIALAEAILWLTPSDGPLGTGNEFGGIGLLITVFVTALVAGGLRRGRRRAWLIAVVAAVLNTSAVVLLPVEAILAARAGAVADTSGIGFFLAGRALWAVVLVVLILGRSAFRSPSRRRVRRTVASRDDRQAAIDLLHRYGGSSISWMATWPDNKYFRSGEHSVVAFQEYAGVAIAVGDPIGPVDGRAKAFIEFNADAERMGLLPAFFSATAATAALGGDLGFRSLQIAEDTVLDLRTLEFKGKPWQDVRTALNRAGKEGISFRLVTLADEPTSVVAQLRSISEHWVGDKGLPELGFTLGSVDEAMDRAVRVGIAVGADGSISGFVSWLPVYAPGGTITGWTLDLMRRRDGGFRPVVEFLIARSALTFQSEGAHFLSLSGAPLARTDSSHELSGLPRLLDSLGSLMEPMYAFRSLHAFKAKFQPQYQPMFLVYRDEADLPRIGLALAKAYLPGAPMRDLLRMAHHA